MLGQAEAQQKVDRAVVNMVESLTQLQPKLAETEIAHTGSPATACGCACRDAVQVSTETARRLHPRQTPLSVVLAIKQNATLL